MGDAADLAYDAEMDRLEEFHDEMSYLMSDEDTLRKDTAKSRSPKIMSIRKWPHPLSYKQKWCLAYWIWQNTYNY